ncbi:hypothetical protein [Persicobacter psychrovividus]|uniref:Uncharacterized protein n=1 Tax=Persicobacter psychrovividus TaxID=387638 RepID=A0ABM7VAP9_9BACT|nr:hypothetical protein PEPS_02750 [Persicobacter psychrovividus]
MELIWPAALRMNFIKNLHKTFDRIIPLFFVAILTAFLPLGTAVAQNKIPSSSDAIMYQSGKQKSSQGSNYLRRQAKEREKSSRNAQQGLKKMKRSQQLESKYMSREMKKFKGNRKRKNRKAVYKKSSRKARKGGGGMTQATPERFNRQVPQRGENMTTEKPLVAERFKERPSNFDKYRGGKGHNVAYDAGGGVTGKHRSQELKKQGQFRSSADISKKYLSRKQSGSYGAPGQRRQVKNKRAVYKYASKKQMNNRGEYKLTAERFKTYPNRDKFNPGKMDRVSPNAEKRKRADKAGEAQFQGMAKSSKQLEQRRYTGHSSYSGDLRRRQTANSYEQRKYKSSEALSQGMSKTKRQNDRRLTSNSTGQSRYSGDLRRRQTTNSYEQRKYKSSEALSQGMSRSQGTMADRSARKFVATQSSNYTGDLRKKRANKYQMMAQKSSEAQRQGGWKGSAADIYLGRQLSARKHNKFSGTQRQESFRQKNSKMEKSSDRLQKQGLTLGKPMDSRALETAFITRSYHQQKIMKGGESRDQRKARMMAKSAEIQSQGMTKVRTKNSQFEQYKYKSGEGLKQGMTVVDTQREKMKRYEFQSEHRQRFTGTFVQQNKVTKYQDKSAEAQGQGMFIVDTHRQKMARYEAMSKLAHQYEGDRIQRNKVTKYQDKSAEAQGQGMFIVDTHRQKMARYEAMSKLAHQYEGDRIQQNKVAKYQDKSAEAQGQGMFIVDTHKQKMARYEAMSKLAHQYEGNMVYRNKVSYFQDKSAEGLKQGLYVPDQTKTKQKYYQQKSKEAHLYAGNLPARKYYGQVQGRRQLMASRMLRYSGEPHAEVSRLGYWWKDLWSNDNEMKAVRVKKKKPGYNSREAEIWETERPFGNINN